jgi:peptide/nickel transport system substrate-binding protein
VTTTGITRRSLLRNAAILGGSAVVLNACTGGGGGSDNSPGPGPTTLPIEGPTVITDPSAFPKTLREAPEFAAQVKAGKLEPVAQRIGQDPLVIKPVDGIGKYGGEIRMGCISDDNVAGGIYSGPDNLLYWDYKYTNIVPCIARDFHFSSDFRELTLHLRRGMRWSDGQPFTADDIMFWYQDISLNSEIDTPSTTLQVSSNQFVTIEKLDDVTVVFRSPVPDASLAEQLAGESDLAGTAYNGEYAGGAFAPMHYLKQFHPKYTSESAANKLAKDAGFPNWTAYILDRNTYFTNPDLPTVMPWITTRSLNNPPWVLSANPYSIWVDTAGNQLPYVPQVTLSVVDDPQVLNLNQLAGDYDYQDRGLQVASLPVLYANEKKSQYTVHKAPDQIMDCAIILDLAWPGEMGDLLRTADFRRALSLGIDRHAVNETFFLGTGVPSATMCADDNPYFPGAEWRTKWATHDPDQANAMLDKLGLKRGSDGFRVTRSGAKIQIQMRSTNGKADFPPMGDMIRRQWKEIGIDSTSDLVDGDLASELVQANRIMATVNNVYGTEEVMLYPQAILPVYNFGIGQTQGYPYVEWFISNGKRGLEPTGSMGLLKDMLELWRRTNRLPREQRIKYGKQILQTHADQVWTIGVVATGLMAYGIYCTNNGLGNVAKNIINSGQMGNTLIMLPQTFYYT